MVCVFKLTWSSRTFADTNVTVTKKDQTFAKIIGSRIVNACHEKEFEPDRTSVGVEKIDDYNTERK
jgi:hypothetical protein